MTWAVEIEAALWENVDRGYLKFAGWGKDGEPMFQEIAAGKAKAEDILWQLVVDDG